MAAHAKLSASGSSRWLNCTGSIKAENAARIINRTNTAAEYGTCAHELADIILKTGDPIEDYLDKYLDDAPNVAVDDEMIEHVQNYVEYVQSFGGDQFYEVRLDYSHLVPEGFGTSDAVVIKDNVLHVIDLKMGKGVIVDAEENSQGMLYALGAVHEYGYLYDFKTVVIHIYQPRVHNFSSWEISIEDLTEFGLYVAKQAKEALSDNAPRTVGEKVISAEFDVLEELPLVDTLTDETLSHIMNNKKLIESWLKAIEEHVGDTLRQGGSFTGYKLVNGRSSRRWDNTEDAQNILTSLLKDDAFEKKLLTVAKAEKILGAKGKAEIEHLIIKQAGKATLAPINDKRPSIDDCSIDFEMI